MIWKPLFDESRVNLLFTFYCNLYRQSDLASVQQSQYTLELDESQYMLVKKFTQVLKTGLLNSLEIIYQKMPIDHDCLGRASHLQEKHIDTLSARILFRLFLRCIRPPVHTYLSFLHWLAV